MELTDTQKAGLAKLREEFSDNQVSKLPKPTKAQTDAVKADFKKGIRCNECGAWHHPDVVHLDYVGHAALTDRLLDCDPLWSWEPAAFADGLPAFDRTGGLWIKLTVCGVTRLGYGHAAAKNNQDPGAREKEVIGDALRNAAMRFGAALKLWHKGELHASDEADDPAKPDDKPQTIDEGQWTKLTSMLEATNSDVGKFLKEFKCKSVKTLLRDDYGRALSMLEKKQEKMRGEAEKAKSEPAPFDDLDEDEIPY